MTQKWTRVSRRMLFTLCLLGGLLVLLSPAGLTNRLQLAYTYIFRWPLAAGQRVSLASRAIPSLRAVNDTAAGETSTKDRNLNNQIDTLKAQLADAEQEIEKLSHIRHVAPQWERMSLLRADVTVTNQAQNVLFINRGQQDGIAVGQYVVGDMSVIGTVAGVGARTATVRLITDQNSKILVTLGDSKMTRIMEGRKGNVARIGLVRASDPVTEGTKVYAAKKPGLLDAPFVTARVTQCRRAEDPSLLDVTVQPVCDIAALTEVMVIVSSPK